MNNSSDQDLIDACTALKYRLSQGAGVPYLLPIPGRNGNHGILRHISLPSELDSTPAELSSRGIGRQSTNGLVAGFELNTELQVAPARYDERESNTIHIKNGHATYDGTTRLWELKLKHRPVFIDTTSDLRALIDTIRQLDYINSGGTERKEGTQVKFLQQTLQNVRLQLSQDDNEVARLQLELKTLKSAAIHTKRLQRDVFVDKNTRIVQSRQSRIDHGKKVVLNILNDPITHVAAIQILSKSLPLSGGGSSSVSNQNTKVSNTNKNNRPTHGNFENVNDVLVGTPIFMEDHTNQALTTTTSTSNATANNNNSLFNVSFQTGVTEEDFNGIEALSAHKLDQIFTHYVVTVCSEGGRRMEINLSHEIAKTNSDSGTDSESKNNNNVNTHGMRFVDLRDECSKRWGLVEHKFMIQTDYSMPVEETDDVRSHLQHLAVSSRIMWGEKPFLIDARDAFKSIDEDNSGQIDVSEFAKLFRRFSTTAQTKIVSVFAEVDIDRSGEITFAEFAEEWDRILRFLKSDIQRNELPICYLLPKQVVTGSNDYASMSAGGSSNSNVTGADKHVIELGRDVGNIDYNENNEDMHSSPILGFEMFDATKTGTITYDEFLNIFRNINSMDMSDQEVKRELRELFNNTNTSRTGTIDFGEFSKNFRAILTKMADHSRVFSENEILQELSQNLGTESNKDMFHVEPVALPMRESSMIREAFIYVVLVVLLTICTFENRDILRSHYMIYKFRQHMFGDSIGRYSSERSSASCNGSMVVDISIPPPSFKPVSLSLSPFFFYSKKHPNKVIF